MFRRCLKVVCAGCALLALASCGDSMSGETGELSTVSVNATADSGPLDADVSVWVNADTGAPAPVACGLNAVPTTAPDSVEYSITSTPYSGGSGSNISPSPVQIQTITLTFEPANTTSPVLPLIYRVQYPDASAPLIPSGTGVTIPVRVVTNELKRYFSDSDQLGDNAITCANNPIYSYRVYATFHVKEVNTDRETTVRATGFLLVNFSDFIDE